MKTMDEKSVPVPVLAVPVPVLVLDEEEAIEDLAVTICAFSAPAAANPAAAQQGAPASFCRNCGQALAAGDAFCPKCGTLRGIAAVTPQPVAASVNAAAAQPAKAKKKKILAIIVAVLALVAIVVGVVAVNVNNAKPKRPDSRRCTTSIARLGAKVAMTEAISLSTLIPLIVRRIATFISLKRIRQLRTSTRLLALTSRFTRERNELTLWRAYRARLATA